MKYLATITGHPPGHPAWTKTETFETDNDLDFMRQVRNWCASFPFEVYMEDWKHDSEQ
jgi:hypothetical protein